MSPRVCTVEGRNTACTLSLQNLTVMLVSLESLSIVALIYSISTLYKDTARRPLLANLITFLANLQRASDDFYSRAVISGSEFES
jgi:hypothetical protein